MIKACEKVSKIIIRDFGEIENLQVSKKGPKDFVTKTDKRVEEVLIDELSKAKKKFSFITEESGIIENSDSENADKTTSNSFYKHSLEIFEIYGLFLNFFLIAKMPYLKSENIFFR